MYKINLKKLYNLSVRMLYRVVWYNRKSKSKQEYCSVYGHKDPDFFKFWSHLWTLEPFTKCECTDSQIDKIIDNILDIQNFWISENKQFNKPDNTINFASSHTIQLYIIIVFYADASCNNSNNADKQVLNNSICANNSN